MLRFYSREFKENDNVKISEQSLIFDSNIWENCVSILKECDQHQDGMINLVPIKNELEKIAAYGYQDNEANRELRMLKELRENKNALQFTDIFPEYKEVIIFGCNELAVSFVKYLEELGISVSVAGKYWNYFGYKSNSGIDIDGEGKLVIYAEGILPQNGDLLQTLKRSVSPEFECIDKIYEKGYTGGGIRDTIGNFYQLIQRLKDEREIIILGDDREAQDTYDLLLAQGIDICCFAVREVRKSRLLGKRIMGIGEAIKCFQSPVFIDYKNTHGALGGEWTEYFDYRGYKRNKQFILFRDYTDIPVSNLVHVLHGKRVLVTGDSRLCRLLSDYLYLVENGEVVVKYIGLGEGEKIIIEKDDIPCLVVSDYVNSLQEVGKAKEDMLSQQLSDMGFADYTEYFTDSRSFALIDLYLNRDKEKYASRELIPKGILLGRIPGWSGNFFFHGIMDGHPEILIMPYSDFNHNLFYYCVWLANCSANKILQAFWTMYDAEAGSRRRDFPDQEKFEASVKRLCSHKKAVTSQELFVIFHIAYAEMISGVQTADISKLVIYWEPHCVSRDNFPFWALWLEDERINGQTIALRRNNIVRTGSGCQRAADNWSSSHALKVMFSDLLSWDKIPVQYHHWTEYKMRFEDIKLNPKEKLAEICGRLGITWSDSMLTTTNGDRPLAYRGSVDFDLKAVFNDYGDFLSELDRFRISIASSPYQKKHGFPYENCLKFSRVELRELFLKPFLFEEKEIFEDGGFNGAAKCEWIGWRLWNVRKQMVLDEICPEFGAVEIKQTADERMAECFQKDMANTMEYAKTHNKLILYGTGEDCQGLLKRMDDGIKLWFLYSDKRAKLQPYIFQGKKVIAPEELGSIYEDYNILVTSSRYRIEIEQEFDDMGIAPSRVFYNKAEFWRYTQ